MLHACYHVAITLLFYGIFTVFEDKISNNWGKLLCDITVGITFQTNKKIPVELLEIVFKKSKQKVIFASEFLPVC